MSRERWSFDFGFLVSMVCGGKRGVWVIMIGEQNFDVVRQLSYGRSRLNHIKID